MLQSITDSAGLSVSLVSTMITVLCQISGIISVSVPTWFVFEQQLLVPLLTVASFRLSNLAWSTTLKLAARVVFINESIGLRLNCPPETVQSGQCLATTGDQLLQLFGFRDLRTGRYLGIMVAIAIANRLATWAFVRWRLSRST
jgi:hypothetical protein